MAHTARILQPREVVDVVQGCQEHRTETEGGARSAEGRGHKFARCDSANFCVTRDRELASTSMVAHGIIVEKKRNCVQRS